MDAISKQTLLLELDNSRDRLRAILERVDQRQEIYPTWTIKHVLAHITGWDEACIDSLEAFLNGTEPGTPAVRGIDFYNAQSVETRQELDYEHVRRECELTRGHLRAVIERIPEDRLRQPLLTAWGSTLDPVNLIGIFIHHEAEHAAEIEAIIARAEAVNREQTGG